MMYSKEVLVNENVQIEINGLKVKVRGPKGEVEREFKTIYNILLERKNNKIIVSCESERRKEKAVVGAIATHIKNMIDGVINGYYAKLKAVYMHFPIKLEVKEGKLFIKNFLGEKAIRVVEPVGKSKIRVDNEFIIVEGIDKEDVMQTANKIEQICRITGYDRRVFLDGIYIIESGKIS
ncbi:MAG: 50S ribosomal protein L6 [Candidatus Aenigmarchaeota archaeon]|nr:50S ribosomal protein L6 [Candidatus Aenigmarchaeota archaeon]MDW8149148.1 50S ribosomal protein L6 [Candidatus Aenigmarchaeota archaeon]